MTKQISNHAAAAQIRKMLKKHGIKARVRASSYAGGSSVNVKILDDVLPATLEQIEAFANRYQYGHFDGMTDCYEYSNRNEELPQVKFVFVECRYSDAIRAEAREYIESIEGIHDYEIDQYTSLAIRGRWGDFWSSRKPRIRAAA